MFGCITSDYAVIGHIGNIMWIIQNNEPFCIVELKDFSGNSIHPAKDVREEWRPWEFRIKINTQKFHMRDNFKMLVGDHDWLERSYVEWFFTENDCFCFIICWSLFIQEIKRNWIKTGHSADIIRLIMKYAVFQVTGTCFFNHLLAIVCIGD